MPPPGRVSGAAVAHLMFVMLLCTLSQHPRHRAAEVLSEFVATFGLMAVTWGCFKGRRNMVPFAVGAYITVAYWLAALTSFANPAVTLGPAFSNRVAGIRPQDVPGFVAGQDCRRAHSYRVTPLVDSESGNQRHECRDTPS
jgi:glycerol uptake facilitator-like aquaporin